VSAVNKTVPDENGNQVPASDFDTEGIEELMTWIAGMDKPKSNQDAVGFKAELQVGNHIATEKPHGDVEVIEYYRRLAEKGDAEAQFRLGEKYDERYGHDVVKDEVAAVKWFRMAAEQGNAEAQFRLGERYADGRGVAKDEVAAVKWYRMAAEQGNISAQLNLAIAYENGTGLEKDIDEAKKWYLKAANPGYERLKKELAQLRVTFSQMGWLPRIIGCAVMLTILIILGVVDLVDVIFK